MSCIDRRTILQAGTVLIGSALASANASAHKLNAAPRMHQRQVPKSGEQLGMIGLGTSRVFDVGNDPDARSRCQSIVARLVLSGGSLIDTGSAYFRAEDVVGETARQVGRDKTFLATKVLAANTDIGQRQIKTSQRRLTPGPIDLLQIHNLSSWQSLLPIAQDMKARGLVRYVGVTHHTNDALPELISVLKTHELDFVGFQYSLVEREAEKSLLPLVADRGIAFIANKPFSQGKLFGAVRGKTLPAFAHELGCQSWAQFFLRFIVSHPSVTCVIPGTGKLEHAVDNFAAGFAPPPCRKSAALMADFISQL